MDNKNNHADSSTASGNPYKHPGANEPIGIVIPNLDPALREALGLPGQIASVGILTSTENNMSTLFGADEAVK